MEWDAELLCKHPVYLTLRPWEAGSKGRAGADVVWMPPASP